MTAQTTTAFFDVDETLIRAKSMRALLEFVRQRAGAHYPGLHAWDDFIATWAHASREDINRAYYQMWRGADPHKLAVAGDAWFDQESARSAFWHSATVARLRAHQRLGHRVVLVSGSFEPCLRPIARALDVTEIVCTTPETVDGRLSGRIGTPMIGEGKAAGIRRLVSESEAELAWAYGDHITDAPMLESVGHPVVVGANAELIEVARKRGWPVRDLARGGRLLP